MKNTALVTGGCGFIGSHLVDLLIENGYKVRIIDNLSNGNLNNLIQHKTNHNLEFIEVDIRNLNKKTNFFKGIDIVFHLAGIGDIVPSIEHPQQYMDINVQGTVNVLENSRNANVKRFVYASSSSCYGLTSGITDENHPINPQYPYALSKNLGETVAFHWGNVYNLNVNSICIFNAYGLRVKTQGAYGAVFGVFLKQKLAQRPLTIVGNGLQTRDFVHVKDVARAFYLAGNTKVNGERFNIGSGKPIAILELAKMLGDLISFIPSRPGEPTTTHANIRKAKEILGWIPEIDFKSGVKEMVDNIDSWSDAPLWDPNSIAQATKTWFKYLDKK